MERKATPNTLKQYFNIFLDAEWDSLGKPICFQARFTGYDLPTENYIIFDTKFKEFMLSKGFPSGYNRELKTTLVFQELADDKNVMLDLIRLYVEDGLHESIKNMHCIVNLHMFFSPKDLWIAFGFDRFSFFTPVSCAIVQNSAISCVRDTKLEFHCAFS